MSGSPARKDFDDIVSDAINRGGARFRERVGEGVS